MLTHFCISIRLLNRAFHGRKDRRVPEWPPSPLRVYQALVAAASRMGENALGVGDTRSALTWLERRTAPSLIIAPQAYSSSPNGKRHGHVLSVPNNAMDIVARAWGRGNLAGTGDTDPATHRTMKTVHPTHLLDGDTIHYLWFLPDPASNGDGVYPDVLAKIASNLAALGWGIDMAIGHAALLSDEQVRALCGERWVPGREGVEDGLRVPTSGTLNALIDRHERFLMRVRPNETFDPTPPLPDSAYRRIEYRRATDPPRRIVAAFSLLKPDASGFRPFDTVRSNLTLAGMMRHAVTCATRRAGWPESKIAAFVLGHRESKNENHIPVGSRRFVYLPLPSIEGRGEGNARVVGSIRRVLLTAFADDCADEIAWARRALSGRDLVNEDSGQSVALLSLLPGNEKMIRCYVEPADTWATVTPVVLPGYDDPSHYRRRLKKGVEAEEQKRLLERLNERIDGLLRNAIVQAGFSKELADHAELEWRKVGFWAGTDLADRYGVPDHLKRFPRIHVRLRWCDTQNRPVAVPGPICLGGGRFYGLGLFAAE
ncbi:CRISPR-associated protein Csb2 [Nitrospira tepida]|uniref:CRISPR-associated protein Csb2 n=1 Tax=Nitrospira tepida TaxID=2973512 RepID=A0AA86TBH4_9BACT|nr:type I-U CRISPR-associated protein Csb2 [Nitrospira tepida]CAI4031439.1 CRISPR-associated protein Csb2 [Nitrospira tepida]